MLDQIRQTEEQQQIIDEGVHKAVEKVEEIEKRDFTKNYGKPGTEPQVQNQSQNVEEETLPVVDGSPNGCIYMPVNDTDKNWRQVWDNVVKAMSEVKDSDINVQGEKPSALQIQYHEDTYMVARTRLCVKNDKPCLELRKLDGNGFTFRDTYKENLQSKLAEKKITRKSSEQEMIGGMNEPQYMYFDLKESKDMLNYWKKNIRPQKNLDYNQVELYDALSSLSWNSGYKENFEILKSEAKDIIQPVLAVLNQSDHIPTVYFAALCISTFFNKSVFGECENWSSVETLLNCVLKWSTTKKKDNDEEEDDQTDELEIKRSRETARLCGLSLIALGPQLKGSIPKNTSKLLKKIRNASLTKHFGVTHWNEEAIFKAIEKTEEEEENKK